MTNILIKKMITATTLYFWGTDEIDEASEFWYRLFFKGISFSAIILILSWII